MWLRKNYRHGWENTTCSTIPPSRQLECLVTLLAFKSQIVSLASIPDPDPPVEGATRKPTGSALVYSVATTWWPQRQHRDVRACHRDPGALPLVQLPARVRVTTSLPMASATTSAWTSRTGTARHEHAPQLHSTPVSERRSSRVLGFGFAGLSEATETGQKRFAGPEVGGEHLPAVLEGVTLASGR